MSIQPQSSGSAAPLATSRPGSKRLGHAQRSPSFDSAGLVMLSLAFAAASSGVTAPLPAQTGGSCVPVADRAGRELGCLIIAREELGHLPANSPLYPHLYSHPTIEAARAAADPRATPVESLGRFRLFSIAAEDWKPEAEARREHRSRRPRRGG